MLKCKHCSNYVKWHHLHLVPQEQQQRQTNWQVRYYYITSVSLATIQRSFSRQFTLIADITDVINSESHAHGIEAHMNSLQSQLTGMQEERMQVLGLLDNMGVFDAVDDDVSRHDPLPKLLQVFVRSCTEAVQKGAKETQMRAQQASESAAEAAALRERVAQLETEMKNREGAVASMGSREAELEAALKAAQEKQAKDRTLAKTKIEQLVAERATLQQQLAAAREAQEQYVSHVCAGS